MGFALGWCLGLWAQDSSSPSHWALVSGACRGLGLGWMLGCSSEQGRQVPALTELNILVGKRNRVNNAQDYKQGSKCLEVSKQDDARVGWVTGIVYREGSIGGSDIWVLSRGEVSTVY